MLAQIPNLLTLLRIAAVPLLVLLLHDRAYDWALLVFLAAGVSDGLDGFLAKHYHWESRFGAMLDPIADKLLIFAAYVMLALLGDIPFWLLVAVVFRDLVITSGYMVLVHLGDEVPMRPTWLSKLNTFLQIALVGLVLLEKAGWLAIPYLVDGVMAAVLTTTIASGVHYVWLWGIRRQGTGQRSA
ncbi:MAG: CDP-alcohol phosphatidyltransferase family protein [Pseudomonadota bacterium]|nr:CDP-alcohol phosphatidyltransferase family protein [Pseudomonadota bacterium]